MYGKFVISVNRPNSYVIPLAKKSPVLEYLIRSIRVPDNVHPFTAEIMTFMSGSSKRVALYGDFRLAFDDQQSKIFRFAPTRWLYHQIAIGKILDKWPSKQILSIDQTLEKVYL